MRLLNYIQSDGRLRINLTLTLAVLMSTAALMSGTATLASAQPVYPRWDFTGNPATPRRLYTATLLADGKVLVAGGLNNTGNSCSSGRCLILNTAELYDPATGKWTNTGNLNLARGEHTATLLANGKVLVVGGVSGSARLNSAELYDPVTGAWSSTGNLNTGRFGHTATLLTNGKVLVAGGYDGSLLASTELYDPATGTWSATGNLNRARFGPAIRLLNGKVLAVAGDSVPGDGDTSELYDPAAGTWSMTGSLNTRRFATATLLPNGKVLATGSGKTAELYDPATGTWSFTGNLNYERSTQTSTLLQNGKALVVGGLWGPVLRSAELYDPATGKWTLSAYLNNSRVQHIATLLSDGRVLVAGGYDNAGDVNSAELYDPSASPNMNMIDDPKFMVPQHYFDFLQREPDPDGLAFWTNEITSCGTDAQCIEVKRINVSASFFLSIEFQETGFFVYRVNKAAHGNLPGIPVPIRLDEFMSQTSEVEQGVIVLQSGWEQILESNKQSFLFDPDAGDRFTSTYPTSMTPAEFVDTLFANAGVTPSTAERTVAINEFGTASKTFDTLARTRVLRRVAENPTLTQQEFNRAFVLIQYFGYLRRNPNDAPEETLDFSGYNFWLNKLNSFNGNFIQAEMVKAFLSSAEYRRRFGP